MLVFGVDGRGLAEVDADAVGETHDGGAVEGGADRDGGLGGVEGDEDTAEGFEGGEGVQRGVLGEEVADGFEVCGVEDGGFVEVLREILVLV